MLLVASRAVRDGTFLLLETDSYGAHKPSLAMHIRNKYTNDVLASFHK